MGYKEKETYYKLTDANGNLLLSSPSKESIIETIGKIIIHTLEADEEISFKVNKVEI